MATVLNALWAEIDRGNAAEDRLANKPVIRRVPYLRVYRPGEGHNAGQNDAELDGTANQRPGA